MKKSKLAAIAAIAPLAFAATAYAAEEDAAPIETAPPATVEELVISPPLTFRNRSDEPAPVLSYDNEYFQRFEPLTAGDALKRVPSVTFLSDVLESDGVRLRGLDPGYTQILINGEKVPGGNADRSFFMDRIPAELIERVEIVRSSSANRSGDAVAGTINIVLRDAYSLDGGYVRVGGSLFNDDRFRESVGGVWGGQVGPGRLLVGVNIQGRRNPKEKYSIRYPEPGDPIDNTEVQSDVRNGTDYSLNASYNVEIGEATLDLAGFFVRTDRVQDEDSREYVDGIETDANLDLFNDNDLYILTDNWSLRGKLVGPMAGGETRFKVGFATFRDQQRETEEEIEYRRDALPFPDGDRYTGDRTDTDIEDTEWAMTLGHKRPAFGDAEMEFGVDLQFKTRETLVEEAARIRFNIPNAPAPMPGIPAFTGFAPVAGGDNEIEESRFDPFILFKGKSETIRWEVGLRYESTSTTITDNTVGGALRTTETDYGFLLPSASLRFDLTANDRISLSVARTVRRPDFNFISPATLEAELGDNDFLGNPDLKPETAWGIDAGYEHRIGARGIVGINFFYRDVTDLVEIANTGEVGSEGAGTFVLRPENTGDGKVWGVEFDLSTPLDFIGWDNTGVFLNYSWLDSEITDDFGERRFNSQSDYVFNVGFIQDLPDWGAAFGATYRKQGDAFGRIVGEEVSTSYGADLEIFVEKTFGENLVLRFVGSNLLDSSKDETFDKFTTIGDQMARDYDEYEVETEEAGPVYSIYLRYAF